MLNSKINLRKVPHKPGVYLFKDESGQVIYIGKAIDLKTRVSSPRNWHWDSVSTIVVESELEALILEANLIKKYLPKFNTRLTDDKDYLYIKITKESSPKILTARKNDLKESLKYFGPFPSSKTVK
ncbi:MAG: excinuclease ABC subunit C, partial [Candidatus Daviesbacteria bacterium]|nr:excinuclease ABC subunit C [Candidatus Daviesbacteria bacterium]